MKQLEKVKNSVTPIYKEISRDLLKDEYSTILLSFLENENQFVVVSTMGLVYLQSSLKRNFEPKPMAAIPDNIALVGYLGEEKYQVHLDPYSPPEDTIIGSLLTDSTEWVFLKTIETIADK